VNVGSSGRHLSPAALYEHWRSGVPVVIPLAGEPALRLRVDSPKGRLTLRAPIGVNVALPPNELVHVRLDVSVEGDERFVEISTVDERYLVDGYAMLSSIADRIQLDGVEPLSALVETLATWRSILAMRDRMSAQTEVGLFGELLVVEAILAADALDVFAWRGGLGEEHDFGFGDADVEVKTTTGERRQHWIHGLRQMVPTGSTPLWVLSAQITRGGAEQGRTLPEIIADVLSVAPTAESQSHVERVVEAAGWRREQADLFGDTWRPRTPPLALRVNQSFPCLTPDYLIAGGVDVAAIRQVSYEIDLTDRPRSSEVPPSLAVILQHMEPAGA